MHVEIHSCTVKTGVTAEDSHAVILNPACLASGTGAAAGYGVSQGYEPIFTAPAQQADGPSGHRTK